MENERDVIDSFTLSRLHLTVWRQIFVLASFFLLISLIYFCASV